MKLVLALVVLGAGAAVVLYAKGYPLRWPPWRRADGPREPALDDDTEYEPDVPSGSGPIGGGIVWGSQGPNTEG